MRIVKTDDWHDLYVFDAEDAPRLQAYLASLQAPKVFLDRAVDPRAKLTWKATDAGYHVSTNIVGRGKFYRLDILKWGEVVVTVNYDNTVFRSHDVKDVVGSVVQEVVLSYKNALPDYESRANVLPTSLSKTTENLFERLLSTAVELDFFRRSCALLHEALVEGGILEDKEATTQHLRSLDLLMEEGRNLRLIVQDSLALQGPIIQHQTNETMKKLALVSILFMPLTFLTGIFGMNFVEMPELAWSYGIHAFWLVVFVVVMATVWVLKRNGML